MDEEKLPQEEKKSGNEPIRYLIRVLVGGYLCYLAWDLASGVWKGAESSMSPLLTYLISGGFVLAGLALIGFGLRALWKNSK